MTFKNVLDCLKDEILGVVGVLPDDYELTLDDAEHQTEHSLDWSLKENKLIVRSSTTDFDSLTITVKDAKRAIAMVGNAFLVRRPAGIHPTAIVEDGAKIGARCYVGPHVVVKSCAIVGDDVRIEPGAVIGNEGFGFVRDANNDLTRFPQLGKVIIGDHVEIGANSTIDRGALSDTIIGRDVKINACVHIAHNVRIGEHTVITANVNISGSSAIGDNVWIGPGSIIRDHVEIGSSAYIGMGSNVVKSIPPNEVWCGNPARKLRDR